MENKFDIEGVILENKPVPGAAGAGSVPVPVPIPVPVDAVGCLLLASGGAAGCSGCCWVVEVSEVRMQT